MIVDEVLLGDAEFQRSVLEMAMWRGRQINFVLSHKWRQYNTMSYYYRVGQRFNN